MSLLLNFQQVTNKLVLCLARASANRLLQFVLVTAGRIDATSLLPTKVCQQRSETVWGSCFLPGIWFRRRSDSSQCSASQDSLNSNPFASSSRMIAALPCHRRCMRSSRQ